MWWDHQNLNKPRIDKSGKRWNFRVWHGKVRESYVERVFFWDDERAFCGVVVITNPLHVSRIHTLIEKLVATPVMRERYKRDLNFPLERYYSESPAFPEENSDSSVE